METLEKYKETRQNLFDFYGINPQSKFVTANGPVKNVHYLETGSGKPVILIHGGGSHASEWINIMKPLAEEYHLYAIDRPGHGLTDPYNYNNVDFRQSAIDFVRSFMDATGLKKAFFIGHSMGGYFSISFAMQHPERVEKLLLVGAPAGVNKYIPLMLRMLGTKAINGIIMNTVAKPSVSNMKDIYKKILVADINNVNHDFLIHSYLNYLLPGTLKAFSSMLENVLNINGWRNDLYIGDKLHLLKIPVRFIWGDKDAFEKPERGIQKTKTINDCQFEVIKEAGHAVWFDQPEKTIFQIKRMIEI